MHIIAVYGSLKKGKYNHRPEEMRFIGDSKVKGSMYLCYSYPHLYPESRSVKELVREYPVELYEVSEETFNGLDSMERGAGYSGEVEYFVLEDGTWGGATIWYKNGEGKDSILQYIIAY